MLLSSAVFTVWAVFVAWFDCRVRRVPNALAAVGAVAAFVCAAMHVAPLQLTPASAAFGALAGFVALLPFFVLGVMGAADVKVFAVVGAWCGATALLGVWVIASIASALHVVALLAHARMRSGAGSRWVPWPGGQPTFAIGARRATPYAALLVGAASLHLLGRALTGAMH
ncbi:A24 family peptidase [Trinickia sp. NRRL B-1857]|uniref:A24 family peptidase n=1 Tax=Trinickia sp. NRRL B-1857 TaxID=3162879 RepID=UPI003D28196D